MRWIMWTAVFVVLFTGCRARPQVAIYVEKDWDVGDNLPARSGVTINFQ